LIAAAGQPCRHHTCSASRSRTPPPRTSWLFLAIAGAAIPVTGLGRTAVHPASTPVHVHAKMGWPGARGRPGTATSPGSDAVGFRSPHCRLRRTGERVDLLMIGPLITWRWRCSARRSGRQSGAHHHGRHAVRSRNVRRRPISTIPDPDAPPRLAAVIDARSSLSPAPDSPTDGLEIYRNVRAGRRGRYRRFAWAFGPERAQRHIRRATAIAVFIDTLAAASSRTPAIVTRSLRAALGSPWRRTSPRHRTVVDPSAGS